MKDRIVSILLFVGILFGVFVGLAEGACPVGDLNGDCIVDIDDLVMFAGQWLDDPGAAADLVGGDGVDIADYGVLAGNWLVEGNPLVINEFMAVNSYIPFTDPTNIHTTVDGQQDNSDWIEIYNPDADSTISLDGLYLTDDENDLTKWRFPDVSIAPGDYLVVWASRKTIEDHPGNYPYVDDPGHLHTNFSLSQNGEYLALVESDGVTIISDFAPEYPEQRGIMSYGNGSNGIISYLLTPTLGQSNSSAYAGVVADTKFSVDRGFFEPGQAFDVAITSDTSGAVIRYTLDGSTPTLSNGNDYSTPIHIDSTTCLRGAAFKTNWLTTDVDTQTYIFLDDVIAQSPNGETPTGWPASNVNGQVFDYGMDPDIVGHTEYGPQMLEAMKQIPSISLVTDMDNLVGSTNGIYVNATLEGIMWERPTSVELINPDGSEGFQANAGLRIRGAFSRGDFNPKHSFRLLFKGGYGPGELDFPMFGDEGVKKFDNIDLRTAQNYAWSNTTSNPGQRNTFIRDIYSRDLQREMGRPYTRSRYYHLYLNGQYWGMYQSQERSEASYAASYFGGYDEYYDVIKTDSYRTSYTDGSLDKWNELWYLCENGLGTDAEYYALQGKDASGDDDLGMEVHVDVDNLIDYMLDIFFAGNRDAPITLSGTSANNFYAIRNRKAESRHGWQFFAYDSEHSMLSVSEDRTRWFSAGSQIGHFNPQWLHQKMMEHSEYRMRFADQAQKHFFNDGAMTTENAIALCQQRIAEIDFAIIGESARWGDQRPDRTYNPYTKAHWWDEVNGFLVNAFLSGRNQTVLNQLKSRDLYPQVQSPTLNQHGGQVATGFEMTMSAPTGTIYYTLDGSDPRELTSDSQTDEIIILDEDASKAVLVPESQIELQGYCTAKMWTGIPNSDIASLTGNSSYPNSPDIVEYWDSFRMYPYDRYDNYGVRVQAYLSPPVSGNYTFWISTDDNGSLLLSTDENPENASEIAYVPGWSSDQEWSKYLAQQSAAIYLEAGNRYYIEALLKEQSGGDNLAVAWQGPAGSAVDSRTIIAGEYLSTFGVVWTLPQYDDSQWTVGANAVAYERDTNNPTYATYAANGIDIGDDMYDKNTSCYIRIPFEYDLVKTPASMKLYMKYDDGYIAYLNGVEIARDNVNETYPPSWNTDAQNARNDDLAISWTGISVPDAVGLLKDGTNILAVHALNTSAGSSDFLCNARVSIFDIQHAVPSANAIEYTGAITLEESALVKSRVLDGSTWSALNEAVFAVGPVADDLRITEVMYHPAGDPNSEFIELKNIGAESINLNLVKFTNGVDFTFPAIDLAAGEFILVVKNTAAFNDQYPTFSGTIAGQFAGALDNDGDRVRLEDAIGTIIHDFKFKDGWYDITDGGGFTLTISDPANATLYGEKDTWRASTNSGGSPGVDDIGPNASDIVINELLAHSDAWPNDWVELYNTSGSEINIGGWYLSDNNDDDPNLMKYQIAEGTTIAADGYIVLTQDEHFGSSFALSENGEKVCLTSAAGGVLTGYRETEDFGASEVGVSMGRYYKASTDTYNFVAMSSITDGSANAYPKVGPIVISEIMYNPAAGGTYDNDEYEFIELYNVSGSAVTLEEYDAELNVTTAWKFTDGIDYAFPLGTTITAGGRLVIARNIAAFAERYGYSAGVLGPFENDTKLSNGGERLQIGKPGDTDASDTRYYIRIDRVTYSDGSHPVGDDPWPTSPDGGGDSLKRIILTNYGNDHVNWQAE